jgi:hypothetical protein
MKIIEKLENYTVDDLISCAKIIVDKDPKHNLRRDQQHLKADMELTSLEGNLRFSLFIRQHAEYRHNFSIGLVFKGRMGEVKLIRFNGAHKRVMEEIDVPHYYCHIHREKDVENNLNTLSESEITDKYSSFEDALCYALEYLNVTNYKEYFSSIEQLEIF